MATKRTTPSSWHYGQREEQIIRNHEGASPSHRKFKEMQEVANLPAAPRNLTERVIDVEDRKT